jgi:hypothetical protein
MVLNPWHGLCLEGKLTGHQASIEVEKTLTAVV